MTKEETIKLHRILWNWLADHPEKEKENWPGWREWPIVVNNCFLCNYANEIDLKTGCLHGCCLLDWGSPGQCHLEGSYYALYDLATDLKQKTWLAKKIANLKELRKD